MVKNILKKVVAVSMAVVAVVGCALSTPAEAKAKSDEYQTKIKMYTSLNSFALTQNIYLRDSMKRLNKYIDADQEILRLMMMDYKELENEGKKWDALVNQKKPDNVEAFRSNFYDYDYDYIQKWQIDDAWAEGLAYNMRSIMLRYILVEEIYYYTGKDLR